jgi:hypothetical protein
MSKRTYFDPPWLTDSVERQPEQAESGGRLGSLANPSTGQIGPTFRSDLRLSVPTISSTAHRAAHAVALKQVLEVTTAILGEFNRSLQHPEIRELQWQQQNKVAVDVVFVRR